MSSVFNREKTLNRVVSLPIERIMPNPFQPRSFFDPDKLEELASSIKHNGLLQPITVRRIEKGQYQLIAGERRLLACRKLGMVSIPAIVEEMDGNRTAVLALIENLQRDNLNYFEEARAICKLMQTLGENQLQIAARLGKTQPTIANKLRLLKYPQPIQEMFLQYNLTERHARALLKLPKEDMIIPSIKYISTHNLNVSQTERYVNSLVEKQHTHKPTRLFIVKDLRIFFNTIEKALDTMKCAGIYADANLTEEEEFVTYTVRIPKKSAYRTKTPA